MNQFRLINLKKESMIDLKWISISYSNKY